MLPLYQCMKGVLSMMASASKRFTLFGGCHVLQLQLFIIFSLPTYLLASELAPAITKIPNNEVARKLSNLNWQNEELNWSSMAALPSVFARQSRCAPSSLPKKASKYVSISFNRAEMAKPGPLTVSKCNCYRVPFSGICWTREAAKRMTLSGTTSATPVLSIVALLRWPWVSALSTNCKPL